MAVVGLRFSVRQMALGLVTLSALILCITYLVKNPVPANDIPLRQVTQVTDQTGNLLNQQWSYMPGVSRKDGVLTIRPTMLSIVNQDGSGGQPNPPVNLYGTRLENAEAFDITGTIAKLQSQATIQLYGKAPVVADEFRIEAPSIRMTVSASTVEITIWDGTDQSPIETAQFPMARADAYRFLIKHADKRITIAMNGTTLGSLADHGIFTSKQVLFGLDGTASWQLTKLQAKSLTAKPLVVADSSTLSAAKRSADSLQGAATAKRPGFKIGAAMALGPATADKQYAEVALGGDFGSITTENALKWQAVHPQPGVYAFQQSDALVALAKRHDMVVHGHTLVFGEANPRWVTTMPFTTQAEKDKVRATMTEHIAKVAGHYKGKVTSWDVINEPLADYDEFESGQLYRNSIWYKAMGPGYIATAFKEARKADPKAQLFMNEFGLEEDGERWDAFLKLVTSLKLAGVPIDGVGFQAHVYESSDAVSSTVLRKHIRELAKIGLKSRISENDVLADKGTGWQANEFASTLKACISELGCISYTTWGISDRYDTFKDDDGSIQYGEDLPWDTNMQPTPAVQKMKDALK